MSVQVRFPFQNPSSGVVSRCTPTPSRTPIANCSASAQQPLWCQYPVAVGVQNRSWPARQQNGGIVAERGRGLSITTARPGSARIPLAIRAPRASSPGLPMEKPALTFKSPPRGCRPHHGGSQEESTRQPSDAGSADGGSTAGSTRTALLSFVHSTIQMQTPNDASITPGPPSGIMLHTNDNAQRLASSHQPRSSGGVRPLEDKGDQPPSQRRVAVPLSKYSEESHSRNTGLSYSQLNKSSPENVHRYISSPSSFGTRELRQDMMQTTSNVTLGRTAVDGESLGRTCRVLGQSSLQEHQPFSESRVHAARVIKGNTFEHVLAGSPRSKSSCTNGPSPPIDHGPPHESQGLNHSVKSDDGNIERALDQALAQVRQLEMELAEERQRSAEMKETFDADMLSQKDAHARDIHVLEETAKKALQNNKFLLEQVEELKSQVHATRRDAESLQDQEWDMPSCSRKHPSVGARSKVSMTCGAKLETDDELQSWDMAEPPAALLRRSLYVNVD